MVTNDNVITLERCREVLKNNDLTLDDNTLKELRTYLYFLGGLQIEEEMAREGQPTCAE